MFQEGEVITTPFTFASTTQAIVQCGLTPVFCDINEDNFTIDTTKIDFLCVFLYRWHRGTRNWYPLHSLTSFLFFVSVFSICQPEDIQGTAISHLLTGKVSVSAAIEKIEDLTILFKADRMISDRTLTLLLAFQGTIFRLPETMSCYQSHLSEDGNHVFSIA